MTIFKAIVVFSITLFTMIGNIKADDLNIVLGKPNIKNFPEICVNIFVHDKEGNQFSDFDSSTVMVYEDSVQNFSAQLKTSKNENENVAILIAVDASLSMAGEPMDSVKAAIKQVISKVNDGDHVGILSFHDDVEVITNFSQDKKLIEEKTKTIKAKGRRTEMHYGIVKGVEMLSQSSDLPLKRVMIVLSDGKDEGAAYSDDDAIQKAKDAGIPIYSIGYHTKAEKKYLRVLERISEKTGGMYNDAPSIKRISQIYSLVLAQIRDQYKLCFVAQEFKADSMEHKINISISIPSGKSGQASILFRSPSKLPNKIDPQLILIIFVTLILIIIYIGNNNKKKKALEDIDGLEEEKATLEKKLEEEKRAREADEKALKSNDRTKVVEPQPDPRSTVISSQKGQEGVYQIQLHFENGPLSGQSFLVSSGMTIGRASENKLVVSESTISGKHCQVEYVHEQYYINDLGSTNGTLVNGNKVSKSAIKQGDKISLGSVNIIVK